MLAGFPPIKSGVSPTYRFTSATRIPGRLPSTGIVGSRVYLGTARVQIMSRVYGAFYHAAGPVAELRNQMLGSRTPEQAYQASEWLYGGGV